VSPRSCNSGCCSAAAAAADGPRSPATVRRPQAWARAAPDSCR